MSDLLGGGTPGHAGAGRPTAVGRAGFPQPAPTSSPASAIRTPRDILNAREARRRAETDAAQDAEDAQRSRIELEQRRSAERRAAAAGIAAQPPRDSGYRTAASTAGGRTPGDASYIAPSTTSAPPVPGSGDAKGQQPPQARSRATTTSNPTRPPQPAAAASSSSAPQGRTATQNPQPGAAPPSRQSHAPPQSASNQRNSNSGFPHAFERWEQLSGQWEGVTSHWIKILELHTEELAGTADRPTVEHMGRYITDLSAAGANLFHAVVELQRLRASSERKFQRWFFETRDQQQRDAEETSKLRAELENERTRSSGAVARLDFERQRNEMKREMQIAKEEARRAWEELGRREEAEREQQYELSQGNAVFVGGVQVLPSSVISRGTSLRQPERYTTQPASSGQEYELLDPSPTDTDPFTEGSQRPNYRPIPTGLPAYNTAPVLQQPQSSAPTSSTLAQERDPSGAAFYRQPQTYLHESQGQPLAVPGPSRSAFSASESEEDLGPELDENGNVRLDSQGRPIPFRGTVSAGGTRTAAAGSGGGGGSMTGPTTAAASSRSMPPPPIPPYTAGPRQQHQQGRPPEVISSPESSEAGEDEGYILHGQQGARYTTQQQASTGGVSPADYEGQGFGTGRGWEEMEGARQHHHPTRLSDVMEEEDERSRASGSRASPGY